MTRRNFDGDRHKQVLAALLIDIARILKKKAAFKGGTAAMLFYGLPRLSLDLDFDLLAELTGKEYDEMDLAMRRQGRVAESRDKHFTLFFLLVYEAGYPNIKLEFNKRIWNNNAYEEKDLDGCSILTANRQTIFSNKLVALTDRQMPVPRDLFDVYYFLQNNFPISPALIQERTGRETRDYLKYLMSYIEKNYTKRIVLQGLGEVLDESQKDWARDNLISSTIRALDVLSDKFEK